MGAYALCVMACSGAALADDGVDPYFAPAPGMALDEPETRERLGTVRIFTNDWFGMPIGDRFDRWRTGAYQASAFWGNEWNGTLPSQPFELMEYHFRGEIIAPDNLAVPAATDRLYAPALYFGAATHFEHQGVEVSLGGDLVITGPQTRLMDLHDSIHRIFGGSDVDLSNFMIEDGIHLNLTGEGGRSYDLGAATARPFAEVQVGVENIVRAGVDFRFGGYDDEALMIRDPITGQRVLALPGDGGDGWSFSAGGDLAFVGNSVLLPDAGPDAEDMRYRVRGGVNYAFGPSNFFYGVTYMSEEFVTQPEGQLVGTMSLMLRF